MKVIYISFSLLAALLCGMITPAASDTQRAADIENEAHAASWRAFCVAYGHDETTTAPEVINDYLDTWRGSVEEENALTPEYNNAIN